MTKFFSSGVRYGVLVLLFVFSTRTVGATPPAAGTKTVDLDTLIEEAMQNHPDLKRIRRGAAASREVPSRVGSLPDPILRISPQNFRIDDFSMNSSAMTGIGIGLMQTIPFPGKLSRRSEVATKMIDVADEQTALLEAQITERIRAAYWRVHFAERAFEVTQQDVKVLDMLTAVVNARMAVGQAPQQDVLQAEVAFSELKAALQEREQALRSARRALNGAVGRDPNDVLAATTEPPNDTVIDRMVLDTQMQQDSPFLSVARARVDVGVAALAEADYDVWPNLFVGLQYRIRAAAPGDPSEGADMVSLDVGISLPVWAGSKQSARVREQDQRLAEARALEDNVRLTLRTNLERTIDEIERLNAQIKLYTDEILPLADQALSASISDYQYARVGFVSVLDNWKTQLDLQIKYEALITDRAQRAAEIQTLIGQRKP